MNDIYNRFRNYVLTNALISPGEKILLSLSAGKDSMFMLHLVRKLQQEYDFTIGAFHLNHLTRGDESDKDEIFVNDLCRKHNIPCYNERYDFNKNKQGSISFEEHARDIRYSYLKKISEVNGYLKIATAHNLNDNAETVLMRILSGTGIAGIKGILPLSKNIIRPVLFADKSEIYSYLKSSNLEWREDLSNNENLYMRNYLRNIILPSITERFPMAEENISNLSGHAVENQLLISNLADKLYPENVIKNETETIIDINIFHKDIPLIKFFISRTLSDVYGLKIKISVFNEIIRRFKSNQANMVLYEKDSLIIRKSLFENRIIIRITDEKESRKSPVAWEYPIIPDNSITRIDEIKKDLKVSYVDYNFFLKNKERPDIIFIQPENIISGIIIRNRRPGDRMKIETGTKKIKEFMIEKKLDSRIKDTIPLIVADNQIAAYLPGLVNSNNNRVACNFHISNDTKSILAFFFRDF